jgi:hypothetical protein
MGGSVRYRHLVPMTGARARPVLQVDQAQVSRGRDGAVVIDDPGCPWIVRVWTSVEGSTTVLDRLRLDRRARANGSAITAARLGRLPVSQILRVAAAHDHPNEVYFRMLAQPRQPGQRTWDDGHWDRVLAVHQWAIDTARPGGPLRAVAELWGVTINPTVHRWLAHARRRPRYAAAEKQDPLC